MIRLKDTANYDEARTEYGLQGYLVSDATAVAHIAEETYEAMNKKVAAAMDPVNDRMAAMEMENKQLRGEVDAIKTEVKEVKVAQSELKQDLQSAEDKILAAIAASAKSGGGGGGWQRRQVDWTTKKCDKCGEMGHGWRKCKNNPVNGWSAPGSPNLDPTDRLDSKPVIGDSEPVAKSRQGVESGPPVIRCLDSELVKGCLDRDLVALMGQERLIAKIDHAMQQLACTERFSSELGAGNMYEGQAVKPTPQVEAKASCAVDETGNQSEKAAAQHCCTARYAPPRVICIDFNEGLRCALVSKLGQLISTK